MAKHPPKKKTLPCATVNEVIDALGGIKALENMGFSYMQIIMWRSRGKFSDRVKPRLLVETRRRRIRVAPELVGLA